MYCVGIEREKHPFAWQRLSIVITRLAAIDMVDLAD
jgi:hypothetical protein